MGKELRTFSPALQTFDELESVMPALQAFASRFKEELTRTENTQPAIFATDLWPHARRTRHQPRRVASAGRGRGADLACAFLTWTALLVRYRAELMVEACAANPACVPS